MSLICSVDHSFDRSAHVFRQLQKERLGLFFGQGPHDDFVLFGGWAFLLRACLQEVPPALMLRYRFDSIRYQVFDRGVDLIFLIG